MRSIFQVHPFGMYIRRLVGSENVWFPSKSHSICNGKDQSIKLLKLKRITDRAAVNSENVKVIKNQELMNNCATVVGGDREVVSGVWSGSAAPSSSSRDDKVSPARPIIVPPAAIRSRSC